LSDQLSKVVEMAGVFDAAPATAGIQQKYRDKTSKYVQARHYVLLISRAAFSNCQYEKCAKRS
jgi:hypothetical protein